MSNPSNSLAAAVRELAGLSSDEGRDIYLSDGGHFENLGVYEMLRRRCAFILVSDAGADPTCTFFDLGGLVRKAKIDFDVDILFGHLSIGARAELPADAPKAAWALGLVRYPEGSVGAILYLKPTYVADLPVDVQSYGNGSKAFPHESTGDQFVSESQFESYRNLGWHLAMQLGSPSYVGFKEELAVQSFFSDAFDKAQAALADVDPMLLNRLRLRLQSGLVQG
ncbi:MAG: hypothetical protein JO013_07280 [Alphaproteobacteria bacterium]|nr:hypothetical protein [Alphaproteobacteria bacterium]